MTRRCPICKEKFTPSFSTLQKTCGEIPCAIAWGKSKQGKEHHRKESKRETRQMKRDRRENDLSWWMAVDSKEAGTNGGNAAFWFHKWIRLVRDVDQPCIMCGSMTPKGGLWNACHYRSRGAASHLRFHPDNVWKGCTQCNTRTTGDTAAKYRLNLVDRIGEDRVTALETDNEVHKWTIDECREIRDYYRDLVKQAETA